MITKKKNVGELIYGVNPLIEILKAKRRKVFTIYTTKPVPEAWKRIEPLLPKYPVQLQYVNREVLHRMVDTTDHQGIVALVQPYGFRTKMFDLHKQPLLIMLDGIQDPRNVGAIIRSAYCTGFNGIILCKKDSAPLNATAIKASAGLSEHIEIYQASSALSAVNELKKAGYQLYLATFDGDDALNVPFKSPLCLVIGSEGVGISKNILSSGLHVTLPQRSSDISYNASVAAGILLFLASSKNKKI